MKAVEYSPGFGLQNGEAERMESWPEQESG